MNRRAVAASLVLIAAVLVLSDLTYRKRTQERELREYTSDPSRYVDLGIDLATVVADPKGERLIAGKPKLRVLAHHYKGGMFDKRAGAIVAPSQRRRVWYASDAQTRIILHDDSEPLGQLIYGSERGGKTETLPMWHFWRWIDHLGEDREGGQTAPTQQRLDVFMSAFFARWNSAWYTYIASKHLIVCCDGSRIRLVSTHRQSAKQGSPLQGFGFSWGSMDEAQDSLDCFDDMESRGASARFNEEKDVSWFKQARTATAKDDSGWRDARDSLDAATTPSGLKLWSRRQLLGVESPFVHRSFWEQKKATMSPREYDRRVLAKDVGVELAVYYGWDRKRNLVARPEIATNVTPAVLAGLRSYIRPATFSILCGHDPGSIYNTTTILQCLMFGGAPTWVVVGELQTHQTTAREHAAKLRTLLQTDFHIEQGDSSKAAIYVDPHGKGQAQTDYQSVYMAFQGEELDVFNPAPMTQRINRAPRIEMINRLLAGAKDSEGLPRLVVAQVNGRPVAPKLVEAFESLQKKPGDDNPEGTQRKDEDDKTHAPAATAYALWAYEQEAFTRDTVKRAQLEAKRVRG